MSKLPRAPVVYLAGGLRSGWQDLVIEAVPGVLFIDPRSHRCAEESAYTAWDLTGVERADIVFGYLEADNPGGEGLALEFGAACAMGKHLIYVEDANHPRSRYLGMVRAVSDSRYELLDDGIKALRQACGRDFLSIRLKAQANAH